MRVRFYSDESAEIPNTSPVITALIEGGGEFVFWSDVPTVRNVLDPMSISTWTVLVPREDIAKVSHLGQVDELAPSTMRRIGLKLLILSLMFVNYIWKDTPRGS